jgi:NADP-dependent 3-hydroxy acid dehydrogenase YdfG/acyl carrier protein
LAKLWLAGVGLNWERYYEGQRRQRVSLPTYPFERQRFWIEGNKNLPEAQKAIQSLDELEKRSNVGDWFYTPIWKQAPLSPLAAQETSGPGNWLAFVNGDSGLSESLISRLSRTQEFVATVTIGEEFAKLGATSYSVNPNEKRDYDLLFEDLKAAGTFPDFIIHLWNVPAPAMLDSSLQTGFNSILLLTQALEERRTEAVHLTVAATNLYDVLGEEEVAPERATLVGPCAAIPLEYPNIQCRCIDIGSVCAGNEKEQALIEILLTEARQESSSFEIVYRGGHRWERTFEQVKLIKPSGASQRLRARGVYLITGGLGGIGLAVAEYLANAVAARIVLLGRSEMPGRDEWDHILASEDANEDLKRKLLGIRSLEAAGSEVLVVSADVSDLQQMRNAMQLIMDRFGELNGVFHAAGVPAAGLMQLKTRATSERVLSPKVHGTLVLDEVTRDLPLDFMVLFSSMTSVTGGGPGQLDYCAANAFLDSFANTRSRNGRFIVSIDWGEWQWDAWQEGLMGFDPLVQAYFKENRKRFGIEFSEGMDALNRVLSNRLSQVVVSTQDFNVLVRLSKGFTAARILEEMGKAYQSQPAHPRSLLGTPYVAPQTEMEREIASVWQTVLRIDQVGINDNFFELGGNSLLGLNLISRMQTALGVVVPAYALYQASTVGEIAKFLQPNGNDPELEKRQKRGQQRRLKQQRRRARS